MSAVVQPIDGWGFMETLDGELAHPFDVALDEVGIDVGNGVKGWRGHVVTIGHKYSGMSVQMTPRHVNWTGVVVLWVESNGATVFSGMADTTGLERDWND